jgi:hypothetical protein
MTLSANGKLVWHCASLPAIISTRSLMSWMTMEWSLTLLRGSASQHQPNFHTTLITHYLRAKHSSRRLGRDFPRLDHDRARTGFFSMMDDESLITSLDECRGMKIRPIQIAFDGRTVLRNNLCDDGAQVCSFEKETALLWRHCLFSVMRLLFQPSFDRSGLNTFTERLLPNMY